MQQPRIGNFNHFVHDSINTFCEGYARMSGAIGATREALIAAFCRLDKSLSCCWQKGISTTYEAGLGIKKKDLVVLGTLIAASTPPLAMMLRTTID